MYPRFGLVLMVTHACNLRCTYCYTGAKFSRIMPESIGRKCIDRAIASLLPRGTLELGFFGGEPLLEADLVASLIAYARSQAAAAGINLAPDLTTNGTVTDPTAWSVMMIPDLGLTISCDGLPEVHDRHRRFAHGAGSAERVQTTIRRLVATERPFRVVMVVRPDTVESLPGGVQYLQHLGVRRIEPALDLWTQWLPHDISNLKEAISRCARLWRDGLPRQSIGWFDEKAAGLASVPISPSARCRFGNGEIAVAPSGRLYPCERPISEDADDNPMVLPGHALDGCDFLNYPPAPVRSHPACTDCSMQTLCNTICRCSNYVRTGDLTRPDGLLCQWNQACLNETAGMLREIIPANDRNLTTGVSL